MTYEIGFDIASYTDAISAALLLANRYEIARRESLREEAHGNVVVERVRNVARESAVNAYLRLLHDGLEVVYHNTLGRSYAVILLYGLFLCHRQRADILLHEWLQGCQIDVADNGEGEIGGVGVESLVNRRQTVERNVVEHLGRYLLLARMIVVERLGVLRRHDEIGVGFQIFHITAVFVDCYIEIVLVETRSGEVEVFELQQRLQIFRRAVTADGGNKVVGCYRYACRFARQLLAQIGGRELRDTHAAYEYR